MQHVLVPVPRVLIGVTMVDVNINDGNPRHDGAGIPALALVPDCRNRRRDAVEVTEPERQVLGAWKKRDRKRREEVNLTWPQQQITSTNQHPMRSHSCGDGGKSPKPHIIKK